MNVLKPFLPSVGACMSFRLFRYTPVSSFVLSAMAETIAAPLGISRSRLTSTAAALTFIMPAFMITAKSCITVCCTFILPVATMSKVSVKAVLVAWEMLRE